MVWSAWVWLCAGIELPVDICSIPVIPPVAAFWSSIFIETPVQPVGDQGREEVSVFVWYTRIPPAENVILFNGHDRARATINHE
jgi:hypothetical protein